MSNYVAQIVSIGVLAVLDTYLTATILPIPVWVTFIAWASFFACGGGMRGLLQSVASNWTGILIAAASLFSAGLLGGGSQAAAICVGLGSAAMIVMTKSPAIPYAPAIVFGFASFVGTSIATNHPVTTPGLANPVLVSGLAMLVGALFGFVSEKLANILSARTVTAPLPAAE
jgi:Protein of unknown function (DUF1097)